MGKGSSCKDRPALNLEGENQLQELKNEREALRRELKASGAKAIEVYKHPRMVELRSLIREAEQLKHLPKIKAEHPQLSDAMARQVALNLWTQVRHIEVSEDGKEAILRGGHPGGAEEGYRVTIHQGQQPEHQLLTDSQMEDGYTIYY